MDRLCQNVCKRNAPNWALQAAARCRLLRTCPTSRSGARISKRGAQVPRDAFHSGDRVCSTDTESAVECEHHSRPEVLSLTSKYTLAPTQYFNSSMEAVWVKKAHARIRKSARCNTTPVRPPPPCPAKRTSLVACPTSRMTWTTTIMPPNNFTSSKLKRCVQFAVHFGIFYTLYLLWLHSALMIKLFSFLFYFYRKSKTKSFYISKYSTIINIPVITIYHIPYH